MVVWDGGGLRVEHECRRQVTSTLLILYVDK